MTQEKERISQYYTLEEIAQKLSVSKRTLLTCVKKGELKATMICGGYKVKEEDLIDFINREAKG